MQLEIDQELRLKCLEMVPQDAMDRTAEAEKLFEYVTGMSAERRLGEIYARVERAVSEKDGWGDLCLAVFALKREMLDIFRGYGLRDA